MKNQAKIYSIAINFLIDYWGRYSNLDDWHMEWIQQYVRVRVLKKGELLYIEGESQSRVFIVMEGLLFRNILRKDNKCRIMSVLVEGMATITSKHLFSATPSIGDIVTARSRNVIIEIPNRPLLALLGQSEAVNTLINVFSNKEKHQSNLLLLVMLESDFYKRYLLFARLLPELHQILMHQEVADLLGFSLSSVKRYHKRWLWEE